MFFPKQPTVGVLNAVLSVSALAGMLCPPSWACLPASSSWACLCPCLLACLPCCLPVLSHVSPSWACLRAFLRLVWDFVSAFLGLSPSFVFLGLSLPLSPSLSPMLSPVLSHVSPSWACLRAFLRLVWDFVSALLGLSPSFVFLGLSLPLSPSLSPMLSPSLVSCVAFLGLSSSFSPAGLGFCVRLLGLVSQLAFPAGL